MECLRRTHEIVTKENKGIDKLIYNEGGNLLSMING